MAKISLKELFNSLTKEKNLAKLVILIGTVIINPLMGVCAAMILYRIKTEHNLGNVIRNASDIEVDYISDRDLTEMYNDIVAATRNAGNKLKNYNLPTLDRRQYDVSRGASRMRYFIDYKNLGNAHFKQIVEIGTGRGGFTQALAESVTWDKYTCCSRWKQMGQEALYYKNEKVEYASAVAEHLKDFEADFLISDMGEDLGSYESTILGTERILDILEPWIDRKPARFLIRIPNPYGEGIMQTLERWKKRLGTGKLTRSPDERNDCTTVYFTDGTGELRRNLKNIQYQQLKNICEYKRKIEEEEEDFDEPIKKFKKKNDEGGIQIGWPKLPSNTPFPILKPAEYKYALAKEGPLKKPRNITKFAREIGYHKGSSIGSKGTARNNIVYNLIQGLTSLMPLFNSWMTTSTLPEVTHKMFLDKVDKAPKEEHGEYNRLWAVYEALAEHCEREGLTMRPLTDQEIMDDVNRNGGMGYQEQGLGKKNLGQYIDDKPLWTAREREHDKLLLEDKAELIINNSMGKKEKKQKLGSRVIWFLPATARIHETRWLGRIDHILEHMPFSVGGKPLYDYGEILAKDFGTDTAAICDDVAGWDTRVGATLQSAECAFLKKITPSKQQRKRIEAIYRVYSHPMLKTHRVVEGEIEEAIYWLQGEVASGRRVTYSMNTITNFCVTFSRLAYAKNWNPEETKVKALRYLRNGSASFYRGKISGDDSAVMMSKDDAISYATKGAEFMNEIGMNRKGIKENNPSFIRYSMEEVDFCSHKYTLVPFHGPRGTINRWMPIRPTADILAKASIMIGNPGNMNSTMAWARAQGLTMLTVYPHIPTVRMVAQALLSATDERVAVSDIKLGWVMRNAPWLKPGNAVEIINDCLFGTSTSIKSNHRINSIQDVGYISVTARVEFDLKFRDSVYRKWKSNLRNVVNKCRKLYKVEYTRDWLDYIE